MYTFYDILHSHKLRWAWLKKKRKGMRSQRACLTHMSNAQAQGMA